MGLPWHATRVKVLNIVASATQSVTDRVLCSKIIKPFIINEYESINDNPPKI